MQRAPSVADQPKSQRPPLLLAPTDRWLGIWPGFLLCSHILWLPFLAEMDGTTTYCCAAGSDLAGQCIGTLVSAKHSKELLCGPNLANDHAAATFWGANAFLAAAGDTSCSCWGFLGKRPSPSESAETSCRVRNCIARCLGIPSWAMQARQDLWRCRALRSRPYTACTGSDVPRTSNAHRIRL